MQRGIAAPLTGSLYTCSLMDAVLEIKARLPIDELVRQYVQIQKKGRNFVSLCPFHNDTHPSFLISPDKGIAYCFACQKGGDIFSFYQLIEGVDFPQAIRELGEKAGVAVDTEKYKPQQKDEKDRMRECLEAALTLYKGNLKAAAPVQQYLTDRGVTPQEIETFALGFAADSYTGTYEALLKAGFSKKEVTATGLAIQRELADERIFDRFRNRLMFPIHDLQGRIVGFGGRTLGGDDAKYMNSPESSLYRKSSVLFGLHLAKEAMRDAKQAIIVEGYFDVLACHRAGFANAVAACGTALTEEHAKILKRYVETVVLCLDQDAAGRSAAERAFQVCSKEGLQVYGIVLPSKDPADVAQADVSALNNMLSTGAKPYFEIVLREIKSSDLTSPKTRHDALQRVLTLLQSVQTVVERSYYIREAAKAFGTPETALQDDLHRVESKDAPRIQRTVVAAKSHELFTGTEIALGLFLLYPHCRGMLDKVIPPEEGFAATLHKALMDTRDVKDLTVESLPLEPLDRERAGILYLFCEQHGFAQWNERMAPRELERNCLNANREYLRHKQADITKRMLEARRLGKAEDEASLLAAYQNLLKLSKSSL
jgi:DNA primase